MKKLLIAIAVVVLAAVAAPAFAAMNPFMDVPASHWAYDAVAQLASRGVISGYPDGTFKGPQPVTRYEVASMIARGLAYADLEHASKQDVDLLKRLVVDFSDELNALGLRVDDLELRMGTLDEDLGGWKFSGILEFNAKFGTDDQRFGTLGKNDFNMDKYRVFLDRRINETTEFHARFGKSDGINTSDDINVVWNYYYITTNLGYDIMLDAGKFDTNYEDALGLVSDDGAFIGDISLNGFQFRKDWGMANFKLLLARAFDGGDASVRGDMEDFVIGGNIDFQFNEKFQFGVYGYYWLSDYSDMFDDLLELAVYAKFQFHPSVALTGVFYHTDDDYDTGNAWKVVLAADQDLLKFTSLQLEFAMVDKEFYGKWGGTPYANLDLADPIGKTVGEDTTVFGVYAAQKWNDKWDSWLRYYHFDYDNLDNRDHIGVGVGYQLNPAVHFELAYGYVNNDYAGDSDHLFRFQTVVNF